MPDSKSSKKSTKITIKQLNGDEDKNQKINSRRQSSAPKAPKTQQKNTSGTKRPTNNKPSNAKKTTTKTSNTKATPAKPTSAKKSTNRRTSPAQKPTNNKSTSAKKPNPKNNNQPTNRKKPANKSQQKSIDSFTMPANRKKTIAGETNLELSDLEQRVNNFKSEKLTDEPAEPTETTEKSTKTAKPTRKNHRKLLIFSRALGAILGLSFLTLCTMVVLLNVVPLQYLIAGIGVLGIFALLIIIFLCRQKTKKAPRIILCIIATLCSIINIFGITYLIHTLNFFDRLKGQEYITEKYYVLVEKDSAYQDIAELEGKNVETFNEGIEIYEEALKKFREKVNTNITEVASVSDLLKNLTNHSTDAVLMSAVHQTALAEEQETSGLIDQTRILYTIEVKIKVDANSTRSNIDVTKDPFTIFISGSDNYGNLSDRSRSDVNMLVVVNPNTHEILLVSIPRDYYVQLHGTTGNRDKLTHAGMYGVQMSVDTLKDLFDVDIDFYVKLNFSTLESIVDTIGGVDVYSSGEFVPWTNRRITIPAGNVHMNGEMALAFARERHFYADGDVQRVKNQQAVLTAILKKVSGSTIILTKYSEILDDVASSLETNFSKDDISKFIKFQLDSMPSWQIGQYNVDGTGRLDVTYSMGQEQLFVMEPDMKTVETARGYIQGIMENKTFSEIGLQAQ